MPLRSCSHCGKETADTANRCPHCGHNFGAGLSRMTGFFFLAIIIILAVSQQCGK